MSDSIARRHFLKVGLMASTVLPSAAVGAVLTQEQKRPPVPDRGPRLDLDMVKEFVVAGHRNLERVQQMLSQQPSLANATWDWGGGDFETGLGGAAHMGRRDIALYLLAHNARLDIFAAAMLGKLRVVKMLIETFPGIEKVPGPHGIPLIVHAEKGGPDAKPVLEYLRGLKSS